MSQPHIPIWQANEILEGLQLAKEKEMKVSGMNAILKTFAEKNGMAMAKEALEAYEDNPMCKLGKIAAARRTIEALREGITEDFKSVAEKA